MEFASRTHNGFRVKLVSNVEIILEHAFGSCASKDCLARRLGSSRVPAASSGGGRCTYLVCVLSLTCILRGSCCTGRSSPPRPISPMKHVSCSRRGDHRKAGIESSVRSTVQSRTERGACRLRQKARPPATTNRQSDGEDGSLIGRGYSCNC